jgi:hypothetical protein
MTTLILLKVNGSFYSALTNLKGDIVYKQLITEQKYKSLGGI